MVRNLLLFLLALLASPVCSEPIPAPGQLPVTHEVYSTITGRVTTDGKAPMSEGVALLFNPATGAPPNPYRYWRIPDLITPLDSDGRFRIQVPAGTYYLMVAQKDPDSEIGPPTGKEFLYFYGDREGKPRPVIVGAETNVDLGSVTAELWTPRMVVRGKGVTAVEGVVKDLEGKPVENAVVFAYLSREAVGRPAFVSDRSDVNGRYLLRVSDGGTYYLKVRSVIGGGVPKEGEHLNTIQGFQPVMVALQKGKITKGIGLQVKKFTRSIGSGGNKARGQWKPDNVPNP